MILLLLLMVTSVAAEDIVVQRGCRRGSDFYHGERHQLTVLVAFNDRPFVGDETATLTQWNKIFNTKNLMEDPFKGSVHDYFFDQSYGDFSIIFDLIYVQVSGDAEKYASTWSDDENSQYLVLESLRLE